MMMLVETASCKAYWITGLSTIGNYFSDATFFTDRKKIPILASDITVISNFHGTNPV